MTIKLFVRQDCPRCPAAKKSVEGLESVEVYDVDGLEGLTEASFYGVLSTPSVIVVDADGHEVAGWRGEAPERVRLRMYVE